MSASRPFQGDRRGGVSSHWGCRSRRWGRKSTPLEGVSRLRGKVTKSFAVSPPAAHFFLHRRAVIRRVPSAFVPAASRRSKSCAFSVSAPQFFRRSPALFSFGEWVVPSAGVKCAASRARVTRTRPPFFDFCLHCFTPLRQYAHTQAVACEGFTPFFLHPCLPSLPPRARRPRSRGEDGREVKPSPIRL